MLKVRASQIFSHSMEDVVAAKKALDAGDAFEQVVEKYSTCPSKKQAGDLGWMPEGTVNSLMGQAIGENDKGKIVGPLHTQYGYHILMISDIELEQVAGPFSPNTSMKDLNQRFPEAHSLLFQKFHIGMPVSGYKDGETLGSVCRAQNKSEMEVINYLHEEFVNRHVDTITPEELKAKMKEGDPNLVLLDIRESWERDIAAIDGSQLITRENSESILGSLTAEQEIVLIDWKQDRGPSFRKWLAQRGLPNIRCLEGGIDAWAEKVETRLNRYDIDEDDGYRYEDIIEEQNGPQ